jgi:hypothetical protein
MVINLPERCEGAAVGYELSIINSYFYPWTGFYLSLIYLEIQNYTGIGCPTSNL